MHLVVNSIASFSFMTSSVFMLMLRIPRLPEWSRLRVCRVFLALVFGIVGLSCFKTVLFTLPSSVEVVQTSTLISGGFQALLFCCTGLTFVAPHSVNRRFVVPVVVLLLLNAASMVTALVLFPDKFGIALGISLLLYVLLLVYYQVKFYGHYNHLVAVADEVTDEYSAYSFRWIKTFYVSVTLLGLSVAGIVFAPIIIYDIWMLAAALVYVYVTLCFVNYCARNALVVNKVYCHVDAADEDKRLLAAVEDAGQADACCCETLDEFKLLEDRLEQWVESKKFVENDVVSRELALQMGVSIDVFRAYFKEHLHTDFRQWRMKHRIDYACEILSQHPSYSCGVVGQMVGINDRSNFNKAFLKIMGITPKEYIEQMQSGTA